MSNIKYKNQILATIDHLRSRKSRPDLFRICKFMLKCHKVAPKYTKADLKRCIKEKSVFKVDYKDNVSYRNALKWRKKSNKNQSMSSAIEISDRRMLTTAMASLIYQDQSYLEKGISFEDLVRAAACNEKYSKKQLEAIVNKEISSGCLVKLQNGNLALGPADLDGDSSDSFKFDYSLDSNTKMPSSANSSCRSSPQRMRGRPKKRGGGAGSNGPSSSSTRNAAVRVGERRKMAKKVFDPSDNNVPSKRKRGRPVGSLNKSTIKKRLMASHNKGEDGTALSESQMSLDGSGDELDQDEISQAEESSPVCSVCLSHKSRGTNDRLVECKDCNNKAHLSCLQSGSGILKPRPDNTWQCPHCKTCVVCFETNDAGILTVCSICSDAYHALCHSPRIPERLKAWDQWECNNCLDPQPAGGTSPKANDYKPQEKEDPFLKPHELDRAPSKLSEDVPIDPSIPDITNWTTDEVYEYFLIHHPEAAPLLKEQEFDGQALSMACRADIVKGLGLRLGPALSLYRIVVKLQTRKDDWTMCWG